MTIKIAKRFLLTTLALASGQLLAVPFSNEVCVGSPWAVCWGQPVFTIAESNTLSVKTTNGQTYNNIQVSWKAVGAQPTPITSAIEHCTSSTTTSISGCTVYPDSTGVFTGVNLFGVTAGQYLLVTVSRKSENGTVVNLVQTKVGPLVGGPI